MKKYLLASLVLAVGWTGVAHGQAYLGTPVAEVPPCGSCSHPPARLGGPADCKTTFCQSGVAQMAKSILVPIRLATGSLLPVCHAEVVTKEDLARMIADGGYSPTEIAAYKIKLDEAQAQTRRAAVRYLATVDCHYYPEAELGLIAALRADRNECVRLEAALALGTCRCVSNRVADALSVSAMGCEIDGNPRETSPRVRAAAQAALNRCTACLPKGAPQMLPPPDWTVPTPMPEPFQPPVVIQPATYLPSTIPDSAAANLIYERKRAETIGAGSPSAAPATGQRTLYDLWLRTANRASAPAAPKTASVRPRPAPQPAPPPRPLGLAPLGSEMNLSIPRNATSTPYNN